MHIWSFYRLMICVTLVLLSWSTSVLAATISVTPTGSSSYILQGSSMDGVSGIQLDIKYDGTLATPTVTQGSLVAGAMLAANTTVPGSIKIAIINTNPFSGSGPIASISFKTGSGNISITSTNMIDRNGAPVSASNLPNDTANSSSPSPSASPSPSQPSATNQSTSQAATSNPVYGGSVSLPADQQQQRSDTQTAAASPVPATSVEPPVRTAEQTPQSAKPEAKAEETPQIVVYKGVAERFKQYRGNKTFSAMVKLFDKQIVQSIRQEPSVLVSEGKNKATLAIDIPARITSSPNFAVNGGTLISYKQEKQIKGRWNVVVLPMSGANNVSLTIITGAEEFEYPLTVVQPIKTSLTLDEKGWNKFTKEAGTATAPQHDFNNDGVRDYLDEYIFVANYLAARKPVTAKPASPAKKPAK